MTAPPDLDALAKITTSEQFRAAYARGMDA